MDERYYRPAEVDLLVGDSTKARERLGWEPQYSFDALVSEMVREDVNALAPAAARAESWPRAAAEARRPARRGSRGQEFFLR